jgi:hypothetical protein
MKFSTIEKSHFEPRRYANKKKFLLLPFLQPVAGYQPTGQIIFTKYSKKQKGFR